MEPAQHGSKPRLCDPCMTVWPVTCAYEHLLDICQQALVCTGDSQSHAVHTPVTGVQCERVPWQAAGEPVT